jgi:hypothetical protein
MSDPNTGWGGFTDHFAKKHFDTDAEQSEWYKERKSRGLSCTRENWEEE